MNDDILFMWVSGVWVAVGGGGERENLEGGEYCVSRELGLDVLQGELHGANAQAADVQAVRLLLEVRHSVVVPHVPVPPPLQ